MSLVAALMVAAAASGAAALLLGVHVVPSTSWSRRGSELARSAHRLRALGSPTAWASALAVAVVVFVVLATLCGPVVAAVPAVLCAQLPFRRQHRRVLAARRTVRAAWPAALRDLASGVGAGRSLHQSLVAVAGTGPEPLRVVLGDYVSLSRTLGSAGALRHVQAVLDDAIADRVVEVLLVAAERGGATVRVVLDDLVDGISDELDLIETIETEALEGRINAQAVVALPWCALVLVTASEGPFRDFYASGAGVVVVALAAVLSLAGSSAVLRLAAPPDVPRVVAGGAP